MSLPPPVYKVGTLSYTRPKLAILLFWLLWGDFCYVLMEAVTPSIMPLRFKALGASNTTMSMVLSTVPWAMGMFLNPIISFKSDRFRSRWGRRIPFIMFSLPFLVVCLVGLGFGDRAGVWIHSQAFHVLDGLSPNSIALAVMSALFIAFSFFNIFVNSVFWYLFNDVIPEHLLARFMSWFRLVAMVSTSIYNLLVFQYAESHTTEIFIGAALLYLVGFGSMCLNVREGIYPPAPESTGQQSGLIADVKTYANECHSLWHYWYQFLITVLGSIGGAGMMFMVFFYQSTGLNLAQIGQVNFAINISTSILILLSGWLADRYHPIRVVLAGLLVQVVLVLPAMMIWLFWHPPAQMAYWVWIAISVGLVAPMTALLGVWDPPLFMRLFPRDRYGQFCSANALWRAVGFITGGFLVGIFLDTMKKYFGDLEAYRLIPIWQMVFTLPTVFLTFKLYQSWKRYGGDENYVPPLPDAGIQPGSMQAAQENQIKP